MCVCNLNIYKMYIKYIQYIYVYYKIFKHCYITWDDNAPSRAKDCLTKTPTPGMGDLPSSC